MLLRLIAIFMVLYIFGAPVLARDYIPVDQLGRGSVPSLSKPVRSPRAPNSKKSVSRPARAADDGRTYYTQSGRIKLFGTMEFQRPLQSLPAWLDVIKRNSNDPIFILEKHFNKSTTWKILKDKLTGKSPQEQLRIVNSFWNVWPYREDIVNWNKEDYWAIPAQFLRKSGDCEDYAIVKYFTLKELGFDPQTLRIVVLRDTIRNLAHAVLAVYLDNDVYILDNLSNVVMSHKRLTNYSPQYSVNEFGRWAHIKSKKSG